MHWGRKYCAPKHPLQISLCNRSMDPMFKPQAESRKDTLLKSRKQILQRLTSASLRGTSFFSMQAGWNWNAKQRGFTSLIIAFWGMARVTFGPLLPLSSSELWHMICHYSKDLWKVAAFSLASHKLCKCVPDKELVIMFLRAPVYLVGSWAHWLLPVAS